MEADLFEVPGADEYEIEEEVGHGTYSEVRPAVAGEAAEEGRCE